MHDPSRHQQSLIALCHAAQLPIVWFNDKRHLRVPLLGHRQFLDITAGPTCTHDHDLAWTLHAIHLGELRELDTGRVPCHQPWHHALLLSWAGYRQQGGTQPYTLWRTAPATPWYEG